jgi:mannose-6-phosphate isomerase
VLVALLLNYVELAAGEAVFVGAGVPHCYLRGFGAELMASSDNVLRAGGQIADLVMISRRCGS